MKRFEELALSALLLLGVAVVFATFSYSGQTIMSGIEVAQEAERPVVLKH